MILKSCMICVCNRHLTLTHLTLTHLTLLLLVLFSGFIDIHLNVNINVWMLKDLIWSLPSHVMLTCVIVFYCHCDQIYC